MSTTDQTTLDTIAAAVLRSLAGCGYVYAAHIPGAVQGESRNVRGVTLSPEEADAVVARVSAALRTSHPVDGRAGRVARRYDRLVAEGRKEEAEACFDAPAPR